MRRVTSLLISCMVGLFSIKAAAAEPAQGKGTVTIKKCLRDSTGDVEYCPPGATDDEETKPSEEDVPPPPDDKNTAPDVKPPADTNHPAAPTPKKDGVKKPEAANDAAPATQVFVVDTTGTIDAADFAAQCAKNQPMTAWPEQKASALNDLAHSPAALGTTDKTPPSVAPINALITSAPNITADSPNKTVQH